MEGEGMEEVNASQMSVQNTSNEEIIPQMAEEYSQYLEIDVSKEKLHFDESIDELLTRLDEYLGLVDLIRSDTNLCLGRTLPQIQAKAVGMENVFERIDQLQAFVGVVQQNVATMEALVNRAETEMGTFSSIRKIFNNMSMPSFLSSKQKQTRPQNLTPSVLRFTPPEIFKTSDYLACSPDRSERVQFVQQSNPPTQQGTEENSAKIEEVAVIVVKPREERRLEESSPSWPEIGDT